MSRSPELRAFEVTVYLTEYRVATVLVEALNEHDAREQAQTAAIDESSLIDTDFEVGNAEQLDLVLPDGEDLDLEGGRDE